ncbi:LamG domain-containing protein, partial [Candidatus Woesearchaeota archaeon]|nr:LamG domain-containing protein [Candidatus Woesearchaeota archaeon]
TINNLTSNYYGVGTNLTFGVTPYDGYEYGTQVNSTTINVTVAANIVPVASNVNITPATVTSITPEVGGTWTYTDSNGNPENATVYEWYINGTRALKDGLVSYWKFDNDAKDSQGSNHGKSENKVTNITGKIKNGYLFESANSGGVKLNNRNGLDITTFSIGMWLKPNLTTDNSVFFSNFRDLGSFGGWAVGMDRGLLGCGLNDVCLFTSANTGTNYQYTNYTYDFPNNSWSHLIITYQNSDKNVSFYINGNLKASKIATYAITMGAEIGTAIGNYSTAVFDGILDEVMLWNRTLTAQEIGDLYNMTFYGQIDSTGANHTINNITSRYFNLRTNLTFGVTPYDGYECSRTSFY